jgi:hypothetical protein
MLITPFDTIWGNGFSIFFLVVAAVFLIVAVFYNLAVSGRVSQNISSIRSSQEKIKDLEANHTEIENLTVKYLGKDYPEFEKEIFDKMTATDKDALVGYFVKYPELSTANGFNTIIKTAKEHAKDLLTVKDTIRYKIENLNMMRNDKWIILPIKLPVEIEKIANDVR